MTDRMLDRRSIRLKGYDYSSAGAYFVTICTQGRETLFGSIVGDQLRPSAYAAIVRQVWDDLPDHYSRVELDAFVLMPNHVHGIVVISDDGAAAGLVGAGLRPAPTEATDRRHGLPEIIRAFKGFSSRRINALRGTPGAPVWQRNYYEHIIRDEIDLHRIRQYVLDNPLRWELDRENPDAQVPSTAPGKHLAWEV